MKTGDRCCLDLKKRSWGGKGAFEFTGFVEDKFKDKRYTVVGKLNEFFNIKSISTQQEETIWQANPYPENSNHMYNFTNFAL